MLEHDIDIFEKCEFDYVVTACSSCTETIGELWAKYAGRRVRRKGGENRQKGNRHQRVPDRRAESRFDAERLAQRKADLPRFVPPEKIARNFRTAQKAPEGERKLRIYRNEGSRQVLRLRRKLHAVPLRAFAENRAAQARQHRRERRENRCVRRPACMMQLSNMLALNNDDIKVKHVAEIFADTLDD